MGSCLVLNLLLLLVNGVFGDEVVTVSVKEGDSVTLNTNITKRQQDKMLWYFKDTRIALINGHINTSCLYDGGGGRFRDRLEVDYETGSLTITNITTEHDGRYEAELIRSESSGKRQSLNRNRRCNSTKITQKINSTNDDTIKTFILIVMASLSDEEKVNEEPQIEKQTFDSSQTSAVVAGVCAAVALLVFSAAVGVIYYHRRRSKNDEEKNKNKAQEKVDPNSI